MIQDQFRPFEGDSNLQRKDIAKYFNRVGRGVNCRLDVPVLVLEDVKWASKIFSDLSKELVNLAWEDDRSEIFRILAARHAMEKARNQLTITNKMKTSLELARKPLGRGR